MPGGPLGAVEISTFLTWLAVDQHVASSTQNQALSRLLFLYRELLHQEIGATAPFDSGTVADFIRVNWSHHEEIVGMLAHTPESAA